MAKFDYSKMSPSELMEKRDNLLATVNNYSEKVEKENITLTEEDRSKWVAAIADLADVNNVFDKTDKGILIQAKNATLTNNVEQVTNAVRTLSGAINTKPAFEADPRFGFKTDLEFLTCAMNAQKNPDKADPRIAAIVTNAVGADEYSRGDWRSTGVLIPEAMIDRILSLTPEQDFITSRCTRIPMGASTVKIPARVDKDHRDSVTGGTRVYRTKETATVDKTKDKYEMVALEANELVGEAAATKILMRESPISIPALIEASMKSASVDRRIDEHLNADGNGRPLGVLNPANKALLSVQRTPGQADTVIASGMDVLRMAKHVYGYDKAIWTANHDMFEILQTLVIESPNAAGIIKLFTPVENGNGLMGLLWGRPLFFTEYVNGIITGDGSDISNWDTGFLNCINFSEVLYGELYTEFNRSVHVRFSEREEVFQFVTSNDSRPWWKSTKIPKKGNTEQSPFVTLSNEEVS